MNSIVRNSSKIAKSVPKLYCNPRFYSDEGAVRESGGGFGKKSKAVENKFIYEHDKTLLKNLAKAIKSKPASEPKIAETHTEEPKPAASEPKKPFSFKKVEKFDPFSSGPVRSGGSQGTYGDRESAYEDKYIHDRERELYEKNKKK